MNRDHSEERRKNQREVPHALETKAPNRCAQESRAWEVAAWTVLVQARALAPTAKQNPQVGTLHGPVTIEICVVWLMWPILLDSQTVCIPLSQQVGQVKSIDPSVHNYLPRAHRV